MKINNNFKIKACLFDLDGTLIDSMGIWEEIDTEYLSKYNIELKYDIDDYIAGMSFKETAIFFKEKFLLPDSIEKIMSTWEEMAIEKYKKVKFKTGSLEFLKELKEKGIKIAIGTSNSKRVVEEFIKARKLEKYIDEVLTSCEVENSKPAPDIYLNLANKFSLNPKECLVFEDIPAGIKAGKSAGMITFAMADEFSKDLEREKIALADYFIDDFRKVKDFIEY